MTLVVSPPGISPSPARAGWTRLAATVRSDVDALEESLWIEVADAHAEALHSSADPFLIWMAPVALQRREALQLTSPVDDELLAQVREIQRIWEHWFPELAALGIETPDAPATGAEVPADRPRRTASFFTGGVDSFFTVLRHAAGEGTPRTERIDDLIFVHGFDVPLGRPVAADRVIGSVSELAADLGKEFVVVRTNLRESCFQRTDWSRHSHGAALAGVAHALGMRYSRVLLAATAAYGDLKFWGSHALVDPMFRSSRVRVVHDGAAFVRVQKTEYIARAPIVRAHLRVCWRSETGDNCGRCTKCYRTMLALESLGVLEACATFDRQTLDLARAARLFCRFDYDVRHFQALRQLALREGRPDVADAVERALVGSERLRRRLALAHRLRGRRIVGRWAQAWEARLMRGWID